MAKVPERLLIPKDERELLEEARHLADIGVLAVAVLRRCREEHEQPPTPEPDDRAKAILDGLAWLSTPEAKRTGRPPELTPLSETETGTVGEVFRCLGMGINVRSSLSLERFAEESMQTPEDRKMGRVRPLRSFPGILKMVKANTSAAIHSLRVRDELTWGLANWSDRKALGAVRLVGGKKLSPKQQARATLAWHVHDRVYGFIEAGMTKGAAERAVAEGKPGPMTKFSRRDYSGTGLTPLGHSPGLLPVFTPPYRVSTIQSLLRFAEKGRPPQRKFSRRHGRNKPKTP